MESSKKIKERLWSTLNSRVIDFSLIDSKILHFRKEHAEALDTILGDFKRVQKVQILFRAS